MAQEKVYLELPPFTGRNVPIIEIAKAMHKEIFDKKGDSTIVLSRTSLIGGNKAFRGKTEEYLFTNIPGAERILICG